MTDYYFQQPGGPQPPPPVASGYGTAAQSVESAFLTKVYGWMTLGLAVTGVTAFLMRSVAIPAGLFYLLIFGELGLVFAISLGINRMQAGTATALFILYSGLTGVTLSVLLRLYDVGTIFAAFFVSAGMFAAMALWGWVTKRDLTKFGSFLFMALIGVVIASVVGIFWSPPFITFIWLYVGLFVFLGLTVYEVWQLRRMAAGAVAMGAEGERKVAIIGALGLYLNFINIFIRMLSILGGTRR